MFSFILAVLKGLSSTFTLQQITTDNSDNNIK